MEYAQSYALYNFQKIKLQSPLTYQNLKLVRSFQNSPSETGFILVHVAMVAYSGHLVKSVVDILKAVGKNDRAAFDKGMGEMVGAMRKINQVMGMV
jgi:indoleamine 2,3-dioxygenase